MRNAPLRGTYHAATAFRSADDDGIRVFDPLVAGPLGRTDGIVPLADWAGYIGRTAEDVRLQHSVDNVPAFGPFGTELTRRGVATIANWIMPRQS